jgi:hypothetical protein
MRLSLTFKALAAAAALAGSAAALPSQAAPLTVDGSASPLVQALDYRFGGPGADAKLLEAQFLWGGRNYCWYGGGWHGPGYYWCGYAWRRGFGWGGPVGWHGWGHPGWRGPGWHGWRRHGGWRGHGGWRH